MPRLFFLFSGEHETLPISELKAILEAENYQFKVLEKNDQTLTIKGEVKCIETIVHRAALTQLCGLELFTCRGEADAIVKCMRSLDLSEVLANGESFAVRVKRVKNSGQKLAVTFLESKLGEIILNSAANAKVDLEHPDKMFLGILTSGKFVFGVKLAEVPAKRFAGRRPKEKPFFHPSAMSPKLARCMINLASPKRGELVLDLFCGTGSLLLEAALIGCRVLGLDAQRRMVKGSLENLAYFDVKPEGIMVGDARKPPVKEADCVVTDPPYGRSATTLKSKTSKLVEEALAASQEILGRGKRVCIACLRTLNIRKISENLDYRHVESHFVYVHRGLTREIAVLEKV